MYVPHSSKDADTPGSCLLLWTALARSLLEMKGAVQADMTQEVQPE